MAYWLMKSEPDCYGIDHLIASGGPDFWEGCRNYTVRNWFRDKFQPGDAAFFYHSVSDPTGIAGVMRICSAGKPDPHQWDANSKYFDAKSPQDNPRWFGVDVDKPVKFSRVITLAELREHEPLANMQVLMRGQRLSVMPVTEDEWHYVLKLAGLPDYQVEPL